jgi:hypothetical protein
MPPSQRHVPDLPGRACAAAVQAGATDGQFLGAARIPTSGIGVLFFDPDLGGIHRLIERKRDGVLAAGPTHCGISYAIDRADAGREDRGSGGTARPFLQFNCSEGTP